MCCDRIVSINYSYVPLLITNENIKLNNQNVMENMNEKIVTIDRIFSDSIRYHLISENDIKTW